MFFFLSKTLGIMPLPTNFLIGMGVFGAILLRTRFASLGRRLLVVSVVLLAICGFSPLGNLLLYPLEQRFPPWDAAHGAPDGIIVLGGSIEPKFRRAWPGGRENAADRFIAAAALAHRYPNARIVFSGGSPNLISDDARRKPIMRAAVRKPRHRQSAADDGAAFAQYPGKCRILQSDGGAKKRRALAAGDVGLSYATLGRLVPQGGICRRALSGGLAGRRPRGSPEIYARCVCEGLERTDMAVREWMGLPRTGPPAGSISCFRGLRDKAPVATSAQSARIGAD